MADMLAAWRVGLVVNRNVELTDVYVFVKYRSAFNLPRIRKNIPIKNVN